MKTIWKYPLEGTSREYNFWMPKDVKVLCIQCQSTVSTFGNTYEKPTLWVLVENVTEIIERKFRLITTGEWFDDSDLQYIGTFQGESGAFVGHIFEVVIGLPDKFMEKL
jgi:hypothetical protein